MILIWYNWFKQFRLSTFTSYSATLENAGTMAPFFCRRIKLKYKLAIIIFIGIIYILFQLKWVEELTTNNSPVRGIHFKVSNFYTRDQNNKFTCLLDREIIDFNKVNDDYCDCEDGTDEPGTSACSNGIFYCRSDMYGRNPPLPSNRVNDGICDCCDGSDEWLNTGPPSSTPRNLRYSLGSFRTLCPNIC